jgi:hypothetical protein
MQNVFLIGIAVMLTGLVGCENETVSPAAPVSEAPRIPGHSPEDAYRALHQIDRMELFSLNPGVGKFDSEKRGYLGWSFLGTTLIEDDETRSKIVAAFESAAEANDGSTKPCFTPHYGLRIHSQGTIHDFAISFDCAQAHWYVNQKKPKGIMLSETPSDVWNEALAAGKVRLPSRP